MGSGYFPLNSTNSLAGYAQRGEMLFLSSTVPTEAPLGAASIQPHTAAPPWHRLHISILLHKEISS